MKKEIDYTFAFRSKTANGEPAKVEVTVYKDETVLVAKIIATKEDLTKLGYETIRKFSTYGVYVEFTSFYRSTLLQIAMGLEMSEEFRKEIWKR